MFAQVAQIFRFDHGLDRAAGQRGFRRFLSEGPLRERQFLGAFGRGHRNLEHEAIFLRFGQRIGSFILDGILRGEHGEAGRQPMRFAVDGHRPFLHGLEQGRLRLRRGAIDFVGEQERSEHRTFDQSEFVALKIKHVGAGDVGGHEVGRELNAGELAAEHVGQRADEQRFADARHAFDKRVVAGENDDERFLHDVVLADNDFGDFVLGLAEDFF